MTSSVNARTLAATVLTRVWADGAFTAPALDAELKRAAQLDARERGLTTQLVYGVLRCERALMQQLRSHTKNDRWESNHTVRAHLLIASFSMYGLERIPSYAAVDAAVRAVSECEGERLGGFCNAVLRKMSREVPEDGKLWLEQTTQKSLPGWLRRRLKAQVGDALAEVLSVAETPPVAICLRAGQDRDEWLVKLREAAPNATFTESALSPRGIVARGAGDLRALPGVATNWRLQEEGAQLVALCTGAKPGMRVLDACAGHGGKTMVLKELVGSEGTVVACDRHPRKLERMKEDIGALVDDTFAVEWTRGVGDVPGDFDIALVDSPCSGSGTLRRRPEIIGRLTRQSVNDLQQLQVAIVRRVATRVRDGGTLIYVVCSLLKDEAEDVLELLTEPVDGVQLEPCPFDSELARKIAEDKSSFRLLPHVHGTDGYFIASMRVRRVSAPSDAS